MEYKPAQRFGSSLDAAKAVEDMAERIRTPSTQGSGWRILWKTQRNLLTANRIPEIADDIVNIDNAVKWGFNHEFGTFELWDVIGVEKSVAKMREDGLEIPPVVQKLLESGKKSFYERREGRTYYFDFASSDYKEVPARPGVLILKSIKERTAVIKKNASASLIDIGDGVACLEFHSR
jgi:3-hydroxyacyl-CoA dehydrogenase